MIKIRLLPIAKNINLPTVIKTAILPGENIEKIFVATQIGEILIVDNEKIKKFLDIRSQVIKLGKKSGYEERGLLGLAFHPNFNHNGLFYIHYSVAGTQGPGALSKSFKPSPCKINTLNLEWIDREIKYDHIDTVEEWIVSNKTKKLRTILNLRRPFSTHNGFNSLNFSPETGKLVLTTGDGGSAYDPFNLSQNDMEIAGKIIEIDINKNRFIDNPPITSRFNELPIPLQKILTVIGKGIRNTSGISYQKINNKYIKYIGNVGQRLVESIFSFINYKPIPVTEIVQKYLKNEIIDQKGFINLGWRGWEGDFPTLITNNCSKNSNLDKKIITYYDEAVITSTKRIQPLISYFHKDPRTDKFEGTALTGVKPYMGSEILELTGNIIFTDLENKNSSRGILAYTNIRESFKLNDFNIIEVDYKFESKSIHYVGLGTNLNQTKLYLGVYGSTNELNQGSVFEIIK